MCKSVNAVGSFVGPTVVGRAASFLAFRAVVVFVRSAYLESLNFSLTFLVKCAKTIFSFAIRHIQERIYTFGEFHVVSCPTYSYFALLILLN